MFLKVVTTRTIMKVGVMGGRGAPAENRVFSSHWSAQSRCKVQYDLVFRSRRRWAEILASITEKIGRAVTPRANY